MNHDLVGVVCRCEIRQRRLLLLCGASGDEGGGIAWCYEPAGS